MKKGKNIPEVASLNRPSVFEGSSLISDPVHGYISFTVPKPGSPEEITEKNLIDTPWMQRLRYIYQLQSARWVYPSAEHSRFQHSLGAMHVAGRFATHLYPSLKSVFPDCPSAPYVEELLRVTALVHDIGHGPFGHFFDENVLEAYGLTHEMMGQKIIMNYLSPLIKKIRRSPRGSFKPDEALEPEHVAFLILKDSKKDTSQIPKWLGFLQPLIGGIYTGDNLDYVLRDSYMCGVAVGPVDLNRLIHYTFFSEKGLTIHKVGLAALQMFLNTRLYLYSNVYYHRTTRAIDIHLRDIFTETIQLIFPQNPAEDLEAYRNLTDWSLLEEVRGWTRSSSKKKLALGMEWERILNRDIKWKMAYDVILPTRGGERGRVFMDRQMVEDRIREALPPQLRDTPFRVDMANQDPRPLNPLSMGGFQIYVWNPSTKMVSKELLREFFDFIPAKIVHCRVFSLTHDHDSEFSKAAEKVLGLEESSIKTNV